MFQKVKFRSFLWLVSLCGVLIIGIMGCGEEVNNQPVIEEISDITLNVDTESAVEVNVTDTDSRDTYSVRASSNDTAIATVSVNDTTLTISTIAEGVTTITVSAEDDSGVDNAESTPVTFQVTIEPYVDKGFCAVGMTLEPGESCTYFVDQTVVVFSVNDDLGCLQTRLADGTLGDIILCASPDIDRAGFRADKNHDKSWTIERLP